MTNEIRRWKIVDQNKREICSSIISMSDAWHLAGLKLLTAPTSLMRQGYECIEVYKEVEGGGK